MSFLFYLLFVCFSELLLHIHPFKTKKSPQRNVQTGFNRL